MTIHIEYETKIQLEVDYQTIIRRVVNGSCDFIQCPYETEVNVILTDDAGIQEINREQRGMDAPTDVLSFPMIEYETSGNFSFLENEEDYCTQDYFSPDTGELMLGDIVISVEKVVKQASEYGHSPVRELAFLVAHSMMHLFGYDHMEPSEAVVMEEKQQEVLNQLGITR